MTARPVSSPAPLPSPPPLWMTVGTAVTLLPVDIDTGLLRGEVTHWLSGAAGLIATIGVSTTAEVAATCAGQRLWLAGNDARHGDLLVFEVIARQPSPHVDTTLALTGVLPLAHELRRAAVRAPARHPARMTFDDGTTTPGVAIDLSHTGCLIALNRADELHAIGSVAQVEIDLPGRRDFVLAADVVRNNGASGEVAVRFRPTDIDLSPIDRLVYATVKRRQTGGE
jgi:hypothetical protein